MRKQLRGQLLGVLAIVGFGTFAGGCTNPGGPDAEREPVHSASAVASPLPRPDTTVNADAGGTTEAGDTVGRGGGFIGSGH